MMVRLYYSDAYLTRFRARVTGRSAGGMRLYLDQTAFYPASGGQPFDLGSLNGVPVTEVAEEDDGRIVHAVATAVDGDDVEGVIDWERRFDHMQQHSGQHLLSAVLSDLFSLETVSFHLGSGVSTIDLAASAISPVQIEAAERRANRLIAENRPVRVTSEAAAEAAGLRKASERTGELRIVSIEGVDRSACGGTHVRATGEIGALLVRRTERMRGNVRLEFVCGLRAIRRARADYDALSRVAQVFSSSLDDAPSLVAALKERLQESEKARQKLALEAARQRGSQLYDATAPGPGGTRFHKREAGGAISEDTRTEAQSFTARPGAVFLAACKHPGALLLAVSTGTGNAGDILRQALAKAGGRGGGTAQLAQGSLPDEELDRAICAIEAALLL